MLRIKLISKWHSEIDFDLALSEHLGDFRRASDIDLVQLAIELLVILFALVRVAPEAQAKWEMLVAFLNAIST